MNIFKFFSIAAVAFSALFFSATPEASAQQTREHVLLIQMHVEPLAAAYIKFDGVDGECQVQEGRNTVGRNTRTGEQLIVVVKRGKLVEFGTQAATGAYQTLSPASSPCISGPICTTLNPPKCFRLPGGACVCVCGPWITAAGSN